MWLRLRLIAVAGLGLAWLGAAAPIGAGEAPDGERMQVIESMTAMYSALGRDDSAGLHAVVAPDFHAFDNGKQFSADTLMSLIKALHAAGKVFVWTVTEPEVVVEGKVAWITYVNKGSIQDASGLTALQWLESAVLRKQGDRWRIAFFHSTRVPSG
jgi:ketosteroid isomerase-like protein